MRKLLLMSMLFLTIGIPAVAARDRNAHRGLRKTLVFTAAYYVVYWLALLTLYLHLGD
jgi:hypothetical protein